MPLCRRPAAFSHPDRLFEIKHDGFHALAYLESRPARLVSRRGHVYKSFARLCEAIGRELHVCDVILEGEIVCLDGQGQLAVRRTAVPLWLAILLRLRSALA